MINRPPLAAWKQNTCRKTSETNKAINITILYFSMLKIEERIVMLPEACVANILSFTTPADTFSSASVSSVFRVAGDSDFVWEKFLPSDYSRLISTSTHKSFSSKKELYRCLCESILIDNGRKVNNYVIGSFYI